MTENPTPPDEPKTPMWLPALGAALFLLVGIWWAATRDPEPSASDAAAPSASAAPSTPPPTQAARPADPHGH